MIQRYETKTSPTAARRISNRAATKCGAADYASFSERLVREGGGLVLGPEPVWTGCTAVRDVKSLH
jgi:hypothetical protein